MVVLGFNAVVESTEVGVKGKGLEECVVRGLVSLLSLSAAVSFL